MQARRTAVYMKSTRRMYAQKRNALQRCCAAYTVLYIRQPYMARAPGRRKEVLCYRRRALCYAHTAQQYARHVTLWCARMLYVARRYAPYASSSEYNIYNKMPKMSCMPVVYIARASRAPLYMQNTREQQHKDMRCCAWRFTHSSIKRHDGYSARAKRRCAPRHTEKLCASHSCYMPAEDAPRHVVAPTARACAADAYVVLRRFTR